MPIPVIDSNSQLLRPDLPGLAVANIQDLNQYIGLAVAPALDVDAPAGTMYAMEASEIIPKEEDSRRASSTKAKRDTQNLVDKFYKTDERIRESAMDDRVMRSLSDNFSVEQTIATKKAVQMFTEHEIAVAAQVYDTNSTDGLVTNDVQIGQAVATWIGNATFPIFSYASEARFRIENKSGAADGVTRKIKMIVANMLQYNALCMCDELRGKVGLQYGPADNDKAILDPQRLAGILGIDEVLIGKARKLVGRTNTPVWSPNDLIFLGVDASPTSDQVNGALRTPVYSEGQGLIAADQYREENITSTIYRFRSDWGISRFFVRENGYRFSNSGSSITNQ